MMPHGVPGSSLPDTHPQPQTHNRPDSYDYLAIALLHRRFTAVMMDASPGFPYTKKMAGNLLLHAVRHLAYPDRDVYPKTRKGTKGHPVVKAAG